MGPTVTGSVLDPLAVSNLDNLSREIKNHFHGVLVGNVRRAAKGPKGNLWRAVKTAKNLVHEDIASNLTLGGGARCSQGRRQLFCQTLPRKSKNSHE